MKIKILIAGVFVLWSTKQTQAQDTIMYLSLKQSCQLGMEKNVNVQNAALDGQKTNYQLKEAESKLYPQVSGYSSFNYYFAIPKMVIPGEIFGQSGPIPVEIGTTYDWSSGFKASQVLYNQSYFTSLKIARQLTAVGDLTIQQKKEEVVYQVSQVYYLCQTTGKQIALLDSSMKNTDKMLEIAKLQNENGVLRKVDFSRIQVNKNNLQTQMDNLQQLYLQQLGLLKYLIGLGEDVRVKLSDSLSFSTLEISPVKPDFNSLTELKLLDKQMETTSLNRKFQRQSYLPSLSGLAQYYYQGQRNEFDFFKGGTEKFFKVGYVGFNLDVPIFSGFERRAKSKQYDIELLKLQNTRQNTSDYFTKGFTDAVRQYDNSLKALIRQQDNIKAAEETYDVSLQGYRQQVNSLSDLLSSDNSLTEARLSWLNALLQLKNAELEVRKAKGELVN